MTDGRCSDCSMWRPHVVYPFVGFCVLWGKLTAVDDGCGGFRPVEVDSSGFYWVPELRSRVPGDEAAILVRRGVKVYLGAYVDPDVRDEIYGAF